MLRTEDLKGTIEFYTQVFGFECESYAEEWGWALLRRDNVSIMFAVPNAHEPHRAPIMTGSLYINTNDVDLTWEALKEKCEVCYPIENFEYGMREFAVYDNNRYLIQIGMPLKLQDV